MNIFFPTSRNYTNDTINNGKVIIIMRTKDRPVLLARALMSVLSQTYNNWHLSLVNDGGDPAPVDHLVAIHQANFNGRITVKHHPQNLGMEAASNAALTNVNDGDYFIVHDDDDTWRPTFLEETVAFLEDHENSRFAAVAARCEIINERIENDRVIEIEIAPWGYWKERIDFVDMLSTNSIPPICLLIRKEIISQIGQYNEKLPVLGDWDYSLRILMIGDIGTINEPLAYYHHRTTNEHSDIYGNSVHSSINKHLDYQVLYRNSMLRILLDKHPEFMGQLHVFLTRMMQIEHKLNHIEHKSFQAEEKLIHQEHKLNFLEHRLNQIHYDLNQAAFSDRQLAEELRLHLRQMRKLLKPFRWGWLLLRPFWRFAKKLAGK